jgi:ribosomal-protein-alanine acetyltransferase
MTAADLAQVMVIECASFAEPWTKSYFLHELSIPFSRCIVAHRPETPEVVAGYLVRWNVACEIHLLNLAVAEGERGHGLGRKLARHVMREACDTEASLVTLEVSIHNLPARALYASLGFTPVRRRSNYYGPDDHALVMHWHPDR